MERDTYEKIANLLIAEVSVGEIAAIVGLTSGRISQIKVDPEFTEIYGKLAAEQVNAGKEMNDAWNSVEQDALAIVVTTLQTSRDPDYALKAATLANKAVRRGGRGNQPIPTDLGTRTVLNLSQTFVQNIQANGLQQRDRIIEGEFRVPQDLMKYNDIQNLDSVEKMLEAPVEKPMKEDLRSDDQKEVADLIAGIFDQ